MTDHNRRWAKSSLAQQQTELEAWIAEQLKDEAETIRQRVYQWLSNNSYFLDDELFDFYLSVAQNIAAVEELGGSGSKILQAKAEIDQAAQASATQIINAGTLVAQQIEGRLKAVNQQYSSLEQKLDDVLTGLATERQNLYAISTGLVSTVSKLLTEQKQVLAGTERAKKIAHNVIKSAYVIPVVALLGWGALAFCAGKLHEHNSAGAINNRVLANQAVHVREACLQQYLENPVKLNPAKDGTVKNCPGFEYEIPSSLRKTTN